MIVPTLNFTKFSEDPAEMSMNVVETGGSFDHESRIHFDLLEGREQKTTTADTVVETPIDDNNPLSEFDVLCGRDKRAFNHPGNRRFRVTISLHQDRYAASNSRKAKSVIIKSVMTTVAKNGGRFVRSTKGDLEELSEKETHEKVSHAFRDMVLSTKKTSQSSTARADKKRKKRLNMEAIRQDTKLPKDQLRSFLNRSLDPTPAPMFDRPMSRLDFLPTDPLPLSDLVGLGSRDFASSSLYSTAQEASNLQQSQEDPFDIFEEVTLSDMARVLDLQRDEDLALLLSEDASNNNYTTGDTLDDAMLHWLVGESDNLFYREQQLRISLINSITSNNNESWPLTGV